MIIHSSKLTIGLKVVFHDHDHPVPLRDVDEGPRVLSVGQNDGTLDTSNRPHAPRELHTCGIRVLNCDKRQVGGTPPVHTALP